MTVTETTLGDFNSPAKGDLRAFYKSKPLPSIRSETIADASQRDATEVTRKVLKAFASALSSGNEDAFQSLFFTGSEVYWKDQIALTWHYRSFFGAQTIARNFLELAKTRDLADSIHAVGDPIFMPVGPNLCFIDTRFKFSTRIPDARCSGRLLLLPVANNGGVEWKIWILSTWIEELSEHPEHVERLREPARVLDNKEQLVTEVFIIGGGNAAVVIAARLKALGVDSIMAERTPAVGDNWRLRYDGLKFHVPTSLCEMPYLPYPKEVQTPHMLDKDDLADQMERYVSEFNLNIINSAKIVNTQYNKTKKQWTIRFTTPQHGERMATAKQLVLATGLGSQKAYMPSIPGQESYKGQSMHSNGFKNGQLLKEQDIKSVLVVGSANTAFDVIENLHAASIPSITMNVRSPTYLCPVDYVFHPHGLGMYDVLPTELADVSMLTMPDIVGGQFAKGLMHMLASQEPDRYKGLREAGFPVLDSRDSEMCLIHNLLERAGGHYTETGGHELIAQRKVGLKALVEPVRYTETGLKFSDGSEIDVDAVIWCTGFSDVTIRDGAFEILGGKEGEAEKHSSKEHDADEGKDEVLTPAEITAGIEPTWGIDTEGEIRGLWRRHAALENFWIMAGYTQQHRWHSRNLAVQIKASLEGLIPEAYRQTR